MGDKFIGETPSTDELVTAAIFGGGPSALVAAARPLARVLTGLRSATRAKAAANLRALEHQGKLSETFSEREIGNVVRRAERPFTEMNMELRRLEGLTPAEIAMEFGTEEAACSVYQSHNSRSD